MVWKSNDSIVSVSQKELIVIKDSSIINAKNIIIKYDNIIDAQIEAKDNTARLFIVFGILVAGLLKIVSFSVALNSGLLGD